jgi:predicted dienelactone hydrolase
MIEKSFIRFKSFTVLIFVLIAAVLPVAAAEYRPAVSLYEVKTFYLELHDSARNREVPMKIYYPSFIETRAETCPVIIFSHGLGGTRDGYEYLGRRWAGIGYVSVHLQHIGSDDAVWKGNSKPMKSMRRAAMNPMNAVNRVNDVRFVIDLLTAMNRTDNIFRGRLDLNRIGVAGHSFGANTAMMIAGQKVAVSLGLDKSFADPRVKAVIAMSVPVPKKKAILDKVYSGIRIPVMHMTGTKDDSLVADTKASERRLPFDHTNAPDQYLIIFKGGDHMVFSGRPRQGFGDSSKDAVFQEYIISATTAFWDAYLKGDQAAKNWLAGGGFMKYLDGYGTFELK